MGDGYGSIDVADPDNPGKQIPFSSLKDHQQWAIVNKTVDGLARGGNLQENMLAFGERVDQIREGGKSFAPRTAKQIKADKKVWYEKGGDNFTAWWGPLARQVIKNVDKYWSDVSIGKPVEPIVTPEQVKDIGSRFGRGWEEGIGILKGTGKKALSLIPR